MILGFALAVACVSASAQSITTLFDGSNGSADDNSALYFDVITNSLDVEVTAWDWNILQGGDQPFGISIWTRPGTASGFETSNAGWAFQTGGSGIAKGQDTPSPITQNTSFTLLANTTTGMMLINGLDTNMRYTNGDGSATFGSGSNQLYSNADVTLSLGSATNDPWANGFFTPRVANVTMYYTAIPEPGSMIALGIGAVALLARRRRKLA